MNNGIKKLRERGEGRGGEGKVKGRDGRVRGRDGTEDEQGWRKGG